MGLAGRLGLTGERAHHREGTNTLLEALQAAGFRPVRLLTEREGFTFVEGFRPSGDPGAGAERLAPSP